MTQEVNEVHNVIEQRRANIGAQFDSNQPQNQDPIEKSMIVEAFTYGENKLFISKTGSEIKQALQGAKAVNEARMIELKTQADVELTKCPGQPTEEMYGDFKIGPADILPKRFTWESIRSYTKTVHPQQNVVDDNYSSDQPIMEKSIEEHNCMDRYNDLIRDWCRVRKENSMISTIISGMSDKQTYKLTIAQANAIGI